MILRYGLYHFIYIVLLSNTIIQSQAFLNHDYSMLRKGVNQIRKYTGSNRPLSDQEWRDFKASAVKIGKGAGAIALAIGGAGAVYYLGKKRIKKMKYEQERAEKLRDVQKRNDQVKLIAAAQRGDWQQVMNFVKQGIKSPDFGYVNGSNILHEILKHNPREQPIDTVIKDLLAIQNVDVNAYDFDGISPLVMVIDGIDFWEDNMAVRDKFLAILDTLMEKNSDVNAIVRPLKSTFGPWQGTLLHYAAYRIRTPELRDQVIKKLKDSGVSPTIKDKKGKLYTDYIPDEV